MHLVSIEKLADYRRDQVMVALRSLLAPLGGMGAYVRPGERVLIKPNMLAAKAPDRAVTTHPEIVFAVIKLVQDAGATALVGDSPGIGNFRKVAERSGMLDIIAESGAELVEFDTTSEVAGEGIFKRFELASQYLAADRIINLPKLKTHEMMTMTCCVKNLFGSVVGTAKAAWHLKAGADRELFARLLLEIYQLRRPDLNIVDAVVAMEGDGPGSGDPRQVGLLLAGENALAVDVIAGELVGIPKKLLHLEKVARRLGLEGAGRESIQTVGAGVEEVRVADFRLPHLSDVQFGLPRFLKNRMRHYLTSRPFVLPEKCSSCGICIAACPPRAICEQDGRLRFDYHSCIRCFCCRELCPEGALDVKEGGLSRIIKKFI